jgi:hypothetical protein
MRYVIVVLVLMAVMLVAQTATNGQITLKPLGASTGCVSDATGAVLCAATDGFYISVAGGAFAKVQTGTATQPTQITCTTAALSSGTTGGLTASGCTFK